MRTAVLALLATALVAGAAQAQDRAPIERQQLADLAYVLGESHALRQTCEGRNDMYWRSRMQDMLQVEAADQGFSNRLTQAFNAGYASGRAEYPYCDPAARAELRRNAQRGRTLAARLSGP
jgi:uncharacterized protein (TIGR02301 family)